MYRAIVFVLLMSISVGQLSAQTPVADLQTLTVLDNTVVRLFWLSPDQPVNVDSIQLFNDKGGPFHRIATVFDATIQHYLDEGAVYTNHAYYLVTWIAEEAYHSDTLQVIYPTAENIDDVMVSLSWNAQATSKKELESYTIWRKKSEEEMWDFIAETAALTYTDTLTFCLDSLIYFISQTHGDSLSVSATSLPISDLYFPSPSVLDSVSVNIQGHPVLGWQSSPSLDAAGTRIHYYNNGWEHYETMDHPDSLFFVDALFDGCESSRLYRIATVDRCGNISFAPEQQAQQNMLLATPQNYPCERQITLSFLSDYINMHPQLDNYTVEVSENGAPFSLLGVWDDSEIPFEHPNVTRGSTYRYRVVAHSSNGNIHASACEVMQRATQPKRPDFGYIRTASVVDRFVQIRMAIDTSSSTSTFYLYKSDSRYDPLIFYPLDSLKTPVEDQEYLFIDSLTHTDNQIYHYRFYTVDSCGNTYLAPVDANTMLLRATGNREEKIDLMWNEYDGFEAGVAFYLVYRKIGELWDPEPIATLFEGDNTYEDRDPMAVEDLSKTTYKVAALSTTENYLETIDTAWSNECVAKQLYSEVWIPNAFRPKGEYNTLFMPVFNPEDVINYHFQIFNKWGIMVFETFDPYEGWDGTYLGKEMPCQAYAYLITFASKNGNGVRKTGAVILLD